MLAVLFATYWVLGVVRALNGPGWRSTGRWLLAVLVAAWSVGLVHAPR